MCKKPITLSKVLALTLNRTPVAGSMEARLQDRGQSLHASVVKTRHISDGPGERMYTPFVHHQALKPVGN